MKRLASACVLVAACSPAAAPPPPPAAAPEPTGIAQRVEAPLAPASPSPSNAGFVRGGENIQLPGCNRWVLAVARGAFEAKVPDHDPVRLEPGDVLTVSFGRSVALGGTGLGVETMSPADCSARTSARAELSVVRGSSASPLTWKTPSGTMTAHLDLTTLPEVYVGRLEGVGSAPEHSHPDSWEVLAAVDGAGTFTMDGKPARLAPGDIVRVPPGVKHSWTPDPGSYLQAVQIYRPPGPEQRFKALAAAADGRDAGAR